MSRKATVLWKPYDPDNTPLDMMRFQPVIVIADENKPAELKTYNEAAKALNVFFACQESIIENGGTCE